MCNKITCSSFSLSKPSATFISKLPLVSFENFTKSVSFTERIYTVASGSLNVVNTKVTGPVLSNTIAKIQIKLIYAH